MSGLVAIGRSQFLLGFALAGVSTLIQCESDVQACLHEHEDADLIILDEELLMDLDPEKRERIETSIHPVIVPLGESSRSQERLRALVKSTLGVEL